MNEWNHLSSTVNFATLMTFRRTIADVDLHSCFYVISIFSWTVASVLCTFPSSSPNVFFCAIALSNMYVAFEEDWLKCIDCC